MTFGRWVGKNRFNVKKNKRKEEEEEEEEDDENELEVSMLLMKSKMKQKHRTQAAILVLRTTSPLESSRLHMNVSLCLSKSTYQNCHQRGCTAGGRF